MSNQFNYKKQPSILINSNLISTITKDNLEQLIFYLSDIDTIDYQINHNLFIKFKINEMTKKYQYIPSLLKIFILYLINQNHFENNLKISQLLQKFLTRNSFSLNYLTILSNIFHHYPKIEEYYPTFFNYILSLKHFYSSQLLPLKKIDLKIDQNFLAFYQSHLMNNKYLNYYIDNNRLLRIAFLEKKMTKLIYALTLKYLSFIEDENNIFFNQNQQSTILYRGIKWDFADQIMKSEIKEEITFQGFSSQTYDYEVARFFAINSSRDYEVVLKIHYPKVFNFLCFNDKIEKEVLIYPNAKYRVKNKYLNENKDYLFICELEYEGYDKESIEIDLLDYDNKFLTLMIFLNNRVLNLFWVKIYIYLLERLRLLDYLLEKNFLVVKDFDKERGKNEENEKVDINYLDNFNRILEKELNVHENQNFAFYTEELNEYKYEDIIEMMNNFYINENIMSLKIQNELKKIIL